MWGATLCAWPPTRRKEGAATPRETGDRAALNDLVVPAGIQYAQAAGSAVVG